MDILSLINRAGRQRMITQKLIKLYFITRYDLPYKGDAHQEIMEAIENFNSTQVMLMGYSQNSPEISQAIETTKEAWMNFILSFNSLDADKVVDLNSTVLVEMDRLINQLIDQYSAAKEVASDK
jgi:hypothetical protein